MTTDRRTVLHTLRQNRDRLIALLLEIDRERCLTGTELGGVAMGATDQDGADTAPETVSRGIDLGVIHDLRGQLLDVEAAISRLEKGHLPTRSMVDEADLASSVDVDGG